MSAQDLPIETASLLSAHALGALEQGEAAEAERLISSSDVCRQAFEEALETAAAIAFLAEPADPPAELRGRILAAVQRLRDAQ